MSDVEWWGAGEEERQKGDGLFAGAAGLALDDDRADRQKHQAERYEDSREVVDGYAGTRREHHHGEAEPN